MLKTFYQYCLLYIVAERLAELIYSKLNQRALLRKGFELQESSRAFTQMAVLHGAWIVAQVLEVRFVPTVLPRVVFALAGFLFLVAELLRIWTLGTLGSHWNASVMAPTDRSGIAAPYAETFVARGPYRFIRHPNYLVVILEIACLPVIGGAVYSAILFSILNGVLLRRRILLEEQYLYTRPGYADTVGRLPRFIPTWLR